MVTKAPVGKPAVKKPSTALAPWEAELAAAAKKQAAVEKPMGLFKQIKIVAGNMYIEEKPVKNNELDLVVLAAAHENAWFNKEYNAGVASVPACYAFGDRNSEDPQAEMAPPKDCDEPQGYPLDDNDELDKSSGEPPKCANCWANVMGSADKGKGKACANVRRLIVIAASDAESAEGLKEAEARGLKVPVTSVGNWIRYMHTLEEDVQRPCYGAVVKVTTTPDVKTIYKMGFEFQEIVAFDGDSYGAMKKRVAAAEKEIVAPYPKLEPEPEPAKGKGGKPAAKKAAAPARKPSKY